MGGVVGAVGAGLGIVKNLTGGSSSSGGGAGGQQTYDPYGQYRSQAAGQLNTLMNDPSSVLGQAGYQQQLQQGMQTTNRGMAATGQLQSGAEQSALNTLGQNTFSSYYNNQMANLMQLSGASQSPAAAGMAQQQAANLASTRQSASMSNLATGIGGLYSGLSNAYNNYSGGDSAQNAAGYASSGAGYQQSFGSDTQFGSYDSGAYQGPV